MSLIQPIVSPAIFAIRPDFKALSIHASGMKNFAETAETTGALHTACLAPCSKPWVETHREAWRDAKPQRTPCSAEALLKRASRDGSLPRVNAVVDLYNAISLRYAVPVGGENIDAYEGPPTLIRATGDEAFDTIQGGQPITGAPEVGEVIWRDARGATCRRWNRRQGTRTRIEVDTTNMWFVLEALDPMPFEALDIAGKELLEGLKRLAPAARISAALLI